MRENARELLDADGIDPGRQQHAFTLDARYAGQSFTLPIAWESEDPDWSPLRRRFDARHEETFGYADLENDVEIVNVRLVSTGLVDQPALDFAPTGVGDPRIETRPVWFDGWLDTPVLDRERLALGTRFEGPAIVAETGGTTIVPPGWSAEVHASAALVCVII